MTMTTKPFELGVYTFGNAGTTTTAQAIRDALEAVHVAEEVGLDYFGFGEHHTPSMPLSSPTSMVNAAAASTHDIKLGTTVTALSTDEPVRVFEQLATAAAIAPGRIDLVAGRGSSDITLQLFDHDEGDYDMLVAGREANYEAGGMVFAGGPNEIADRVLHLHDLLGHSRQILQMNIGGMPQPTFLKAIELLGTEVLPQIRKELDQR
jgi:alkanesulfonate monooxygenase SsuD/methylene tetrahydromethanopterin reductase-like flavin-dependent oxidoreductase (luciferase family)